MVDNLGHCLLLDCHCKAVEYLRHSGRRNNSVGIWSKSFPRLVALSVYKKFLQELVYSLLQCYPKLLSLISEACKACVLWIML